MKPADWVEILRYFSLVTGIGLTFTAGVWLGWLAGSYLADLWGGAGWLAAGLILGVGAGFITVYTLLKKFLPRE